MLRLLRGAGLREARVESIETIVRCRDRDELWGGVLGGSVRTSTTILRQPEDGLLAVLAHTEPLADWLSARGTTHLHGDLRDEHLGMDGRRVVLSDWGLATQGHPVVELCWYLVHCAWRISATRDQIVEDFRRARGDADDRKALEVGLLSGLVQYGWILGHSAVVNPDPAERAWAREELAWWVPRARRAPAAWSPSGVR